MDTLQAQGVKLRHRSPSGASKEPVTDEYGAYRIPIIHNFGYIRISQRDEVGEGAVVPGMGARLECAEPLRNLLRDVYVSDGKEDHIVMRRVCGIRWLGS